MKIPTGTRKFDNEKRDRAMAKAILDKLGLEPEKYRLGYTKVGSQLFSKGKKLGKKTFISLKNLI